MVAAALKACLSGHPETMVISRVGLRTGTFGDLGTGYSLLVSKSAAYAYWCDTRISGVVDGVIATS